MAKKNGWLLDGMPRTKVQADALKTLGLFPNLFLLLECPDVLMVERACGRRMDPVDKKIYHVKYNPPADPEVAKRLITRSDDTKEKMATRIAMYHKNIDAVREFYSDVMVTIDSTRKKQEIFPEVAKAVDASLK